jgi:hypothetical protein
VGRRARPLRTTWHMRGPLVGSWTTDTFGETSLGMLKLEETIEKPCSDLLAHTTEVCKGTPSVQ